MFLSRFWGARLAVLMLLAAHTSVAQTDQERAAARSAATEGINAFRNQDYETALLYLQKAESVIHAPTHLLFIARSQKAVGRFVEARETYLKLLSENLASDAPRAFLDAQEGARTEVREVEGKIAKLILDVSTSDAAVPEELEVKINGVTFPAMLVGTPMPVNPGKNTVTVRARGRTTVSTQIVLTEGARESLTVVLVPDTPVAEKADSVETEEPARAEPEPAPPPEERTGDLRATAGWISIGAGGILVATGSIFGVLSLTQVNNARSDDEFCGQEDQCTPDGRSEINRAKTKALVADVAMGTGILAVALGTVLLVTSKKRQGTAVGIQRIEPMADRRGGYLTVRGAF